MESRLKLCPFCGGHNVEHVYESEFGRIFDYVQCWDCGAKIRGYYQGEYVSAIDIWNRRANDGKM